MHQKGQLHADLDEVAGAAKALGSVRSYLAGDDFGNNDHSEADAGETPHPHLCLRKYFICVPSPILHNAMQLSQTR